MLSNLKTNAAIFTAFKNHSFKNELVKLLIDNNGELSSWDNFKKQALKLNETYNNSWLKTEYHTAVTASKNAAQWQDFQRRKDLYPNLKYIQIQRDTKRDAHKKWHGIILPIDHKFWDTHYGQNDWGCGCYQIQTDELENSKGFDVNNMPALPAIFNHNVGKTGQVFTPEHPYFKTHLNNTRALQKDVEYYKLKIPEYIYLKDQKVHVSAWADRNDLDSNLMAASLINKKLKTDIKIRPHLEIKKVKNPEFQWEGLKGDLKEITVLTGIRKVLDNLKKQCFNGKDNYFGVFHIVINTLDLKILTRELNRKINQDRSKHLEGLYFIRHDKVVYLSREDIVKRDYTKLLKIQ